MHHGNTMTLLWYTINMVLYVPDMTCPEKYGITIVHVQNMVLPYYVMSRKHCFVVIYASKSMCMQ